MDGEDLSPKSSKRDRNGSPAESSKRSKPASSFVRNNDDRLKYVLSRSGIATKLMKLLFSPLRSANGPQHLTPFNNDPSRVRQQIQKFRNMVPIGSNIVLTDVKIFYAVLPKDQRERSYKKMYRYVFFKFEDAIFSLHLLTFKTPI